MYDAIMFSQPTDSYEDHLLVAMGREGNAVRDHRLGAATCFAGEVQGLVVESLDRIGDDRADRAGGAGIVVGAGAFDSGPRVRRRRSFLRGGHRADQIVARLDDCPLVMLLAAVGVVVFLPR